jgi:membrane protein implicated in regulation of membrane protease activity
VADDSGRSAAWGVVAVVSGGGAVAVWIEAVQSHSAFVPWAAVASALSLLTLASIYMCFAVLNHWPTVRRRERRTPDLPDRPIRGLGRGLGVLIPRPGPLEITLQDENWDQWRGICWVVALKIRISNTTIDREIRLKKFSLVSEIALGAQAKGIFQELQRRSEIYSPSLTPMDLQPDDSISGWFFRAAALPAQGGRPHCTFIVTDNLGDTYELDIPARPQKAHRMPSYYRPDDPEAEVP